MQTGAWGRAPRIIRAVLIALAVAGATLRVAPAPAFAAEQPGPGAGGKASRAEIVLRGGYRTSLSAAQTSRVVAGRYVIELTAGVKLAKLAADYGPSLRIHHRYGKLGGFSARVDPVTLQRLQADPRVASVEEDQLLPLSTTQGSAPWNLDRLDQTRRPLDATYTYISTGKGVHAYIVDSGVLASHSEFIGRVATGFDALRLGSTGDCNGHGTHVASTVAGTRHGVAKRAIVVPVRVGCDFLTTSDAIAALDFIVRDHRRGTPAVANLSWGGGRSPRLDAAVNRVIDDGVTVVVAAGNEGMNSCLASPARVRGALTVGATNRSDAIPMWSNFGRCLDLFAPGVSIRAASPVSRAASRIMSGTSMAAPHVTGAAARYLAAHPKAGPAAVATALKAAATAGVLTGRFMGDPDRLLQISGQAPMRLTSSATATMVRPGANVVITGQLRNAVSNVSARGRTVTLYQRPLGAVAWSRFGSATTGTTGGVRFVAAPAQSSQFQMRHAGTKWTTPAAGAVLQVRLDPRLEPLLTLSTPRVITADETVELTGGMTNARTGAAVNGRIVALYARAAGQTSWSLVDSVATNAAGEATFTDAPQRNVSYQLRHEATETSFGATSPTRAVGVELRVTSALSTSQTAAGETFTVSGTVTPAAENSPHNYEVHVDDLNTEAGWVLFDWSTYAADSGAYSSNLSLPAGNYLVRVVTPDDPLNSKSHGESHALTVTG